MIGISNNMFKEKKILITGISGFLGSSLASRLAELGADIYGIVREQVCDFANRGYKIITGDIQDIALIRRTIVENEIEICLHMAAIATVANCENKPIEVYETNIKGTWNVLEACRYGKKIQAVLIASSNLVLGEQQYLPHQEKQSLGEYTGSLRPYEVSKHCSELLAKSYHLYYKIPVGIARFTNLYGPGDYNFSRIVPGTIRSIIRGEEAQIRGDGQNLRDYVYIEDAVEGCMLFVQKLLSARLEGETINFETGQLYSVIDVVERIIHIFGKDTKCKILFNCSRRDNMNQYLDNTKARRLLSWEPRYSLKEGLERSVEWYVSKSDIR